jgi:hypothetical protein
VRTTLLLVLQAMAASSGGSWARFGAHEHFARANLALQEQPGLADALNAGLRELGIAWARVLVVRTAPDQEPGIRRFHVTLEIDGEGTVHGSVDS